MSTTIGIQVFDSTGTLQWDSRTAVGGVVGDYQPYTSGDIFSYPQWAGLSAMLIDCGNDEGVISVSVSSGYPVVTATSGSGSFALVVW